MIEYWVSNYSKHAYTEIPYEIISRLIKLGNVIYLIYSISYDTRGKIMKDRAMLYDTLEEWLMNSNITSRWQISENVLRLL